MKEIIIDGIKYNLAPVEENKLQDKDLVYCWDNNNICSRVIRFYDAKNKLAFGNTGKRNGYIHDYYEKVPPEVEAAMDWVEEARKALKG